jgi:hypothetical protein
LCHRYLDEIDGKTGGAMAAATQPGNPNHQVTGNGAPPVQAQFANLTKTTVVNSGPKAGPPVNSAPLPLAVSATPRWSPAWGRLRRTQHVFNGQPMFALIDNQNRHIVYAITDPNLTLDTYVNQLVCLWGTVALYRSDYPNAFYMKVSYIARP